MNKRLENVAPGWFMAIGAATLALGVIVSLAMVRGAVDFPVLYVMGTGLLAGRNVYLPEQTANFSQQFGVSQYGMFYPPSTAFALLPFSILSYGVAKWGFAVLIDVTIVFGIRALVRLASPKAPPALWMIVAGVVLASAAMRWGMMLLQVAPLVFGLLCWFVSLLHSGRYRLATVVAILAMSLKMTLSLPFLGLLLLHRRLWNTALVGAAWLSLNLVGFWRMGPGAFDYYRNNIADLEGFRSISSPDPWRPFALPRLDWVSLFYGLTANLTLARFAAISLAGICLLWLAWSALRSRPAELRTTTVFLGALVCLGSLAVYHHHYDAILFFAPAILGLFLLDWNDRTESWLIAPLVAMILVLPIGKAQGILESLLGLTGVGLLKLSFPVAVTMALVGCLSLVRSQGNARSC